MEKVLESIKQKVSAMRHLQEMFKKHPDLEELSVGYYIEYEDGDLIVTYYYIKINDQIWDEDNATDYYYEMGDTFEDIDTLIPTWYYGYITTITNSPVAFSEEELKNLYDYTSSLIDWSTQENEELTITKQFIESLDLN